MFQTGKEFGGEGTCLIAPNFCFRSGGQTCFASFFRGMLDFIRHIYNREDKADPLEASKHMIDFLTFTAKRYVHPVVPSFANAVTAMELEVLLL